MYTKEKKMEMLEAYDLTKSYRAAGQLAGCDPKTVAAAVEARSNGAELVVARSSIIDDFRDKIAELVDRSRGKVRADVVHDRIAAMGFSGSDRTTRRAVATAKKRWRSENHRIYKPWVTSPGEWMQWDYGTGPVVNGSQVILFCAWLAWSRMRFVMPLRDRTLPSVIAALDSCFRFFGGAPTYCLTDNEKTVTDCHVAGIAVRNPQIVSVSAYYGITIATCVPADPESKGGSEATVRIAKADLVPTDHNLIGNYESWEALVRACDEFNVTVNSRVHRDIAQRPVDRFEIEQQHLHRIAAEPYTAAFGETRSVSWSSLINFRGSRYSVPSSHCDDTVWVRVEGNELVVIATPITGAIEIARHELASAGQVIIDDSHYPSQRRSKERQVSPKTETEIAFCALGAGAKRWLVEAAASGVRKIEAKMAAAVDLAKSFDSNDVDVSLGELAMLGRFDTDDLSSVLVSRRQQPNHHSETHSLQGGTKSWAHVGGEQ